MTRRGFACRWLILLLGPLPALGCAATLPPQRSVATELVQVTTADGVRLDGALWLPAEGPGKAPAVLLVHGYAGNFYTAWPLLGEALARRGHLTLALNMRDHDLTPQRSLFEDNRVDIETGIALLARRGASSVVLVGHSMGTNRVLCYLAETQDPRVLGLVLMAGPGNLLEWNIHLFGREHALAVLAEAQQRVQAGRGDELMLVDLGPLGKTLYSAAHVVSLRGPQTRSDPFRSIASIHVPILILHGTADRLADPAIAWRLKDAAVTASSAQLHLLPGLGHDLPRSPEAILPILEPWLEGMPR